MTAPTGSVPASGRSARWVAYDVLRAVHEPEWPADNREVWGGWSPLRGEHLPGTAIFVATRPA